MKHLIDIDTWERKENYLFFRDFHNSWIAMTSEVDCTEAYAEAKACSEFTGKNISYNVRLFVNFFEHKMFVSHFTQSNRFPG